MKDEKTDPTKSYDPTVADMGWAALGRESIFTRMVLQSRWDRQRFKETRQQQTFDKSRHAFITEERLAEYEKASLCDTVTGLFNMRTFKNKLHYELRRAKRYKRPVSLLLMSMDRLDEVKKQYGVLALDQVMASASSIAKQAIRDVDIACRFGQDQLAIIFPETYSSRAIVVGERIRDHLKTTKISDDFRGLRITASIGVVSFPTHARDEVELLRLAEQFVATAHKNGGDMVFNG
jgi:diguanylate cyclase (GGDEF)-like protein